MEPFRVEGHCGGCRARQERAWQRGEAGDRSTEELRSVAYRRLWGTAWKTKKIEEDVGWSRFGTRTWETGVLYWESGGAAGLGDELQV